MTLLLTLVSPLGIYQSSDYRLTTLRGETAIPEGDVVGAKQLTVRSGGLAAQVSFTGVARVGKYKTRDWISDLFVKATQLGVSPNDRKFLESMVRSNSDFKSVMAGLAELPRIQNLESSSAKDVWLVRSMLTEDSLQVTLEQ
jgi:hypothetical protein